VLTLENVEAFYGRSQALFGVDLSVDDGRVVTLLGRNGMGKTTTVRAIMGLNPPRGGRVTFAGRSVAGWRPHRIARLGIGLVPEGRQVFPKLTVAENLMATRRGGGVWDLDRVFGLFPRLQERARQMATTLSGGEQQMLAIGRALMTNPRLLILDEATEGLAPLIRDEIWRCLADLKREGQSILLIDKNLETMIRLADWHFIMEKGRVVWSGASPDLAADPDIGHRYLGV